MFKILFVFMLLCTQLFSGEVKLAWDPNPPEDMVQLYILYERIDQAYIPISTTTTTNITITNVTAGFHCYVVTASNYWGESVFSNEACTIVYVEGSPDPPGTVTVYTNHVSITLENNAFIRIYKSKDLTNWTETARLQTGSSNYIMFNESEPMMFYKVITKKE